MNGIMISVVVLSVVMLSVVMLSVVMLSVVMLSDIMLSVVMVNVMAPMNGNQNSHLKLELKTHQRTIFSSSVTAPRHSV